MKNQDWEPDKFSITLIVLFTFAFAISLIMIFTPSARTIGAIILPVSIIGIVATIVISRKKFYKKLNTDNKKNFQLKKQSDREFKAWLEKFKPYSKLAVSLEKADERCFSKFGGLPIVPYNFKWPNYKNKPLQFLMQIKFSEINSNGELKDFPTKGLLYLFVNEEAINTEWTEEGYKQGKDFEVMFIKNEEPVIESKDINGLIKYKGYNVSHSIITSYPDTEDCKEVEDLVDNRPIGGFDDDYEFDFRSKNSSEFQVGGWPLWVQSSELEAEDGWVLLMQIGSEDNEENWMWGDCGSLYFLIKEKDLKAQDFSKVKLIMQST